MPSRSYTALAASLTWPNAAFLASRSSPRSYSVAVPFVGAFVGALGIAQAMRVSSGQVTAEFLQAELGAPSLATAGRMNGLPPEAMKRLEICVG